MDDYERVLLVKSDVQVYRIPPRTTNRAYRASDWNLDAPDWTCRLRLLSKSDSCFIKLDEKSTGQFFGQCPIDKYPSTSIETVSDSSRYFVLRLVNEQTKRTAFVGIGFVDRSDSFDLNVALQDHFKIMQMEQDSASKTESEEGAPKLDLGFKEGQTIKVNLNLGKKSAKPRPKAGASMGGILLPPPPPGNKQTSSFGSDASAFSPPSDDDNNNNNNDPLDSFITNTATATTTTNTSGTHSNFHQQLIDGLESLNVGSSLNQSGDTIVSSSQQDDDDEEEPDFFASLKSNVPTITPANSFCIDDFSVAPSVSPINLAGFGLSSSVANPTNSNKATFSSTSPLSQSSSQSQTRIDGFSTSPFTVPGLTQSSRKPEEDLWSDFESFNSKQAGAPASASVPAVSAAPVVDSSAKFENWAKF